MSDPHESAARRSVAASASDEILVRAPAEEEEVMFARVHDSDATIESVATYDVALTVEKAAHP
jgi:hypothetical protein